MRLWQQLWFCHIGHSGVTWVGVRSWGCLSWGHPMSCREYQSVAALWHLGSDNSQVSAENPAYAHRDNLWVSDSRSVSVLTAPCPARVLDHGGGCSHLGLAHAVAQPSWVCWCCAMGQTACQGCSGTQLSMLGAAGTTL